MQGWRLFFYGIAMGAADIVPGISGGTVAFLLGIYAQLLDSIRTLNGTAARLFFTFRWRELKEHVAWKFLLPLLSGIVGAFLLFTHAIHSILQNPELRPLLYATFLGLIAASTLFCARLLPKWGISHVGVLAVGLITAYALTGGVDLFPAHSFATTSWWIDPWLLCCGAIAISAMLLPGISGSYLLTILGVYAPVLAAVVAFTQGLKQGMLDMEAFQILVSVGLGIVIGALAFSRVVSWMLNRYYAHTIALLTGFMVGALRSVWPFWSYGPEQQPLDPILPNLMSISTFFALVCAIVGFLAVFILERSAKRLSNES